MSFSKLSIGACGGLMGLGWLSVFWRDLTWISESWAWEDRVGAFGLFICLFSFAWLDSLRPSQQSFGLVRMGQLGGSSEMSVCFDIFHHSRIGTSSYPSVLYQFRCPALGHNTVTLTSVSLELANLQLSRCAPHRHERLRQILSIITLI